jgi:hypothetical protein
MNITKQAIASKLFKWAGTSLPGNMVLSEIAISLPTFIAFTYLSYIQDILTLDRVVFLGSICILEGITFGFVIWMILTKPIMDKRDKM